MRQTKKADMSLETIGKAILVLAVIVILLVIFTNMLYGGSEQITDIAEGEDGLVGSARDCITDPNSEKCKLFTNKENLDTNTNSKE